jgi:acetyl esterase
MPPLDAHMAAVIDRLRSEGRQGPALDDVAARRRLMRSRAAWLAGPGEPVGLVRNLEVPVGDRQIPCRLYESTDAPDQALVVFAHGGGWATGDLETHDALCRAIANRADCLVLAIDYRLAPEHPFPAAVDDVEGVIEWLQAGRDLPSWDGLRIAVAGDSAGANLVAVAAQRFGRGGAIAAQLLIYPILDGAMDTPTYQQFGSGFTLSADEMRWCWDRYCPDIGERLTSRAAPLREVNLAGLPAAALVIAECDVLADEARAYARRLLNSAVPVVTLLAPGMAHGFLRMTEAVPGARSTLDECGRFLRRAFNPQPMF